jgi:4-carboxymuconolactone decarboxylase
MTMDLSSYNRTPGFEQGLEARRRVLGEDYVGPSIARGAEDDFAHQLQQFVTEYCWGTVWCRDGLPDKTRSIMNLTMLAALGRTHELRLHTRGALNNGVTKEEIAEVFLQVGIYAGVPAAVEAFREASKVFEEMGV